MTSNAGLIPEMDGFEFLHERRQWTVNGWVHAWQTAVEKLWILWAMPRGRRLPVTDYCRWVEPARQSRWRRGASRYAGSLARRHEHRAQRPSNWSRRHREAFRPWPQAPPTFPK